MSHEATHGFARARANHRPLAALQFAKVHAAGRTGSRRSSQHPVPPKKSERLIDIVGGLDCSPGTPQRFMAFDLCRGKPAAGGLALDEQRLTSANDQQIGGASANAKRLKKRAFNCGSRTPVRDMAKPH